MFCLKTLYHKAVLINSYQCVKFDSLCIVADEYPAWSIFPPELGLGLNFSVWGDIDAFTSLRMPTVPNMLLATVPATYKNLQVYITSSSQINFAPTNCSSSFFATHNRNGDCRPFCGLLGPCYWQHDTFIMPDFQAWHEFHCDCPSETCNEVVLHLHNRDTMQISEIMLKVSGTRQ